MDVVKISFLEAFGFFHFSPLLVIWHLGLKILPNRKDNLHPLGQFWVNKVMKWWPQEGVHETTVGMQAALPALVVDTVVRLNVDGTVQQ